MMTTTVSLTVFILAREMPRMEWERGAEREVEKPLPGEGGEWAPPARRAEAGGEGLWEESGLRERLLFLEGEGK